MGVRFWGSFMRFDLVGGSDRVLKGGGRKTVRRDPQEEVLYAESE